MLRTSSGPFTTDRIYETRKEDEQKITGESERDESVPKRIESRQNEIYRLRLRGCTNKEISEKLQVSLSTVEKDLHQIRNNIVKSYKVFQDGGVYEAFQDACGQIDMIQSELWKMYDGTSQVNDKLKILNLVKETTSNKLELYAMTPNRSRLLTKLKEEEEKNTAFPIF